MNEDFLSRTIRSILEDRRLKTRRLTWTIYKPDIENLAKQILGMFEERELANLKKCYELGVFNWKDLSPRYQVLLKMRFIKKMPYDKISVEFGVTRDRVRQLEQRAIDLLNT